MKENTKDIVFIILYSSLLIATIIAFVIIQFHQPERLVLTTPDGQSKIEIRGDRIEFLSKDSQGWKLSAKLENGFIGNHTSVFSLYTYTDRCNFYSVDEDNQSIVKYDVEQLFEDR